MNRKPKPERSSVIRCAIYTRKSTEEGLEQEFTQQFNTASSMGRLILNVLLSFAQFEREMISERTRDKIAATRRKGKWCGGTPILGYTVEDTKLIIVPHEADRVRQLFDIYLQSRSLINTAKEANTRAW